MTQNIQDKAALLAYHILDQEMDSAFLEKNNVLIAENTHKLGNYSKYLGRLHDSCILQTEISENHFLMVLNDFATHVFSDVLVEKKQLNIDHKKLVFPIQIYFEIIRTTNPIY